jgi:hypothetical protein
LENLHYKNERSFSFEKFTSKLQKAYNDLADSGQEVNNGDVIDALWDRIQSSNLQMYVASLKIDYQCHPMSYKF